jgi:glutathione S-transferase
MPGSTDDLLNKLLTTMCVQIPYTHKLVDPQNKPEDFKALYASIVANTDDSAKVPVIIGVRAHHFLLARMLTLLDACITDDIVLICADGSNKLAESLVVVEYLDAKYGGVSPLLPNDPFQLGKVTAL